MFYFYHSKNLSNIMKNIFNSISIYFFLKKFLVKKYKKQMFYKENKSLFFWRHEKWPNFSFKRLSFSIWSQMTFHGIIRMCKEARLKKLIKFRLSGCYSFWHFSSCLKIKNHLEGVSPSHFLQDFLIETSNGCFRNF